MKKLLSVILAIALFLTAFSAFAEGAENMTPGDPPSGFDGGTPPGDPPGEPPEGFDGSNPPEPPDGFGGGNPPGDPPGKPPEGFDGSNPPEPPDGFGGAGVFPAVIPAVIFSVFHYFSVFSAVHHDSQTFRRNAPRKIAIDRSSPRLRIAYPSLPDLIKLYYTSARLSPSKMIGFEKNRKTHHL